MYRTYLVGIPIEVSPMVYWGLVKGGTKPVTLLYYTQKIRPKARKKLGIFLIKMPSLSEKYEKVAHKYRKNRIYEIYIISKQFLDIISYPISSTKKGSDIISYILK